MAQQETAYDVLRPFLTLINLYGVNWRSEKRTGWKVAKLLTATWWMFLLSFYPIFFICIIYSLKEQIDLSKIGNKPVVYFTINALTFYTCLILWRQMEDLVGQLKTSRVDQTSNKMKKMKRCAKITSVYLYSFIPSCFVIVWIEHMGILEGQRSTLLDMISDPVLLATSLRQVILAFPLYLGWVFFFFVPFFLCFVAFYISEAIYDSVEHVKRCRSPLRRAKSFSRLLNSYTRLSEMTATADQLASVVMYMCKIVAMFLFLNASHNLFINPLGIHTKSTTYVWCGMLGCGLTITLLYCWYLQLASSVNSKVSLLMVQLAEVWLTDDQWLSRDPTSRFHLLEMRLNQLIELRHMMIVESASLTFMGEPVDVESLFTFCAEIVDTANSMYSK